MVIGCCAGCFKKTEMIPNSVFVDTYVELRHQGVAWD